MIISPASTISFSDTTELAVSTCSIGAPSSPIVSPQGVTVGLGELSHPTTDASVKNKMKENDANFIWLIILESKLEVNFIVIYI
jgi:hypothetical protein